MNRQAQAFGAEQLVKRARLYDQNAMAMIASVRENAMKGDPTAKSAFGLIQQYIQENPVSPPGPAPAVTSALSLLPHNVSPESKMQALRELPHVGRSADVETACALLTKGPLLTMEALAALEGCLNQDELALYQLGLQNSASPRDANACIASARAAGDAEAVGLLCAGHCVGIARRTQLVERGNAPASLLSTDIGWELGE